MSIIGLMPHQSKDLLAGEQRFSKDNHSTKTTIWQIIPSVLQFVPVVLLFRLLVWLTPLFGLPCTVSMLSNISNCEIKYTHNYDGTWQESFTLIRDYMVYRRNCNMVPDTQSSFEFTHESFDWQQVYAFGLPVVARGGPGAPGPPNMVTTSDSACMY